MLKRRDPIAIGSVGIYTENMSNELKLSLDKLKKDINSVLENYQGIDAEVQVNNFIGTSDKLNTVIQNLDYYGKYMQSVASFDSDNLNSIKSRFNKVMIRNESKVPEMLNKTLALDSISNTDEGVTHE